VRRVVFGGESRFEQYLGYMAAAFEVKGYRPRDEGVYVSYGLPGKQVARFATRDDRTVFLFVFAAENSSGRIPHDVQAQKAFLRYAYGDAGWECPQILDALDHCDEVYFDRVSQIHLDRWSRGRVTLVGDAAFCPSLLAGQGSALAMTAAYVLAGELARAEGGPECAFKRYERTLRSFIDAKQRAAQGFAASFAPKTRFGLFLRNQISKTLRVPWIADLVIGRSLLDRLTLPTYP
jgi:2-polyprenyl-6-methoxyphenol hydroxylase-like FAD-dependent oxidoreductase